MPLYNSELYVGKAIESVQAQTLDDWELIIVDDGSTDTSAHQVGRYLSDTQITLLQFDMNQGAAAARKAAIEASRGRYIAFLDADDLWLPTKLEEQIAFMEQTGCGMCFTAYETIRADGIHRNFVYVPDTLDYSGFLKNTITCSHTIMFDTSRVSKELLTAMPEPDGFDYAEDLNIWLNVLKAGHTAHGLNSVLAKNRKHAASRSAGHVHALGRTWNQYRNREGLSVPQSAYCMGWHIFYAIKKRL